MTDLIELKEKIKTEALRLGFTHFGVAPALLVPHYDRFLDWIGEGHQGGMAYLARPDAVAKRGDPGLILDECRSVISLSMPYVPPTAKSETSYHGKGRISAYARSRDYHDTIRDKLERLEVFIHQNSNVPVALRSYVDTGPILERSLATQAGLGTTGKNSSLIIQGTGTYFFLAEMLTDLPLPVDEPITRDFCGSCTRCIDACPASCILPGYTIDARRCISYLTIEHKGPIPDDLKKTIGDWLFGCDILQGCINIKDPSRMI